MQSNNCIDNHNNPTFTNNHNNNPITNTNSTLTNTQNIPTNTQHNPTNNNPTNIPLTPRISTKQQVQINLDLIVELTSQLLGDIKQEIKECNDANNSYIFKTKERDNENEVFRKSMDSRYKVDNCNMNNTTTNSNFFSTENYDFYDIDINNADQHNIVNVASKKIIKKKLTFCY
ncbi:MAG: hypothetical protein Ta2D_04450 [Rickettsiales bacterium]|nr:MAG: hypothetical protein Ta2D_04450 [Rickettsiales bacterium]